MSQISPMSLCGPSLYLATPNAGQGQPASMNMLPSVAGRVGKGTNPVETGSPAMTNSSRWSGLPTRHPRPLTAAELLVELEKESEAIVNRLARELSALRVHSASLASTVSTASGASSPTLSLPSRHHCRSSSLSHDCVAGGGDMYPWSLSNTARAQPKHSLFSVGGRWRELARSSSASRTYGAHSRHTLQNPSTAGSGTRPITFEVTTPRYEEIAMNRLGLEEAKKENEELKTRIRELEMILKSHDHDGELMVGVDERTAHADGAELMDESQDI